MAGRVEFKRDGDGRLWAYRNDERLGPIVAMGDINPESGKLHRLQSIVMDIYASVKELEEMYPGRHFTPDGHLVGSLGEVVASEWYGISLFEASYPAHDGVAPDGRLVQVKATQSNKVALNGKPEYLIVLKLDKGGTFAEVYNGPGERVWKVAGKPQKTGQSHVSLKKLQELAVSVKDHERIPERP